VKSRFAALIEPLTEPPAGIQTLAVGYSGGLDSTALLHALNQHAPQLALRAVHVCHHLQPDAERWAEQCEAQCREWDVAFTRLDIAVDPAGRGVEAAARTARYGAITETLARGEALVTAHHLQDQAETFLLQALRGSGPQGLAAMPTTAALAAASHWRPWLAVSQQAIRDYASHHGLSWVEDPSNADPDVARSFLRTQVLPLIETRWAQAAGTLARSAAHAQEAAEAIDTLAEIDLQQVADTANTLACRALGALPTARCKQVVRRWLRTAGRDTPDHRHLDQIVRLLAARGVASPIVHFADTDVRRFDGRLYCMPALAPAPGKTTIAWGGDDMLTLPNGCGTLEFEDAPAKEQALTIGFRRGGESLLQADGGHRRLKDVLREAGVPPWVRERMPLIHVDGELAVVPGLWRHPEIGRWDNADIGPLIWHHRLIAGTLRVVRA
jgi:tRNA(Ile)-lysidine synthase